MTRTFRLAWPPSVNGYWRNTARGTLLSKKGRQFRVDALDDIRRQLGEPAPIMGRVRVLLELTPPCRRRRDIDNHAKGVLDAIVKAGVLADDEQVDELIIKRLGVSKPGCCDVTITEL